MLAGDFERALPVPGGWRIGVSDDFAVLVSMGERTESLELSDVVDDPEWFDAGGDPEQRREALVAEATEALYDEMLDVFDRGRSIHLDAWFTMRRSACAQACGSAPSPTT